jgi:uncharacterized protein (DUF1499 family)
MATLTIIIFIGLGYFKGMGVYSSSKNPELGIKEGKLTLCGTKPNCVSTSNTNEKHKVEIIEVSDLLESSLATIIFKLKELGLEVVSEKGNYAHLTHTSSIMGYVDDIEIMLNGSQLSIRSASRVGYSDMGANRKRVEAIRKLLM